jgi:hypothetical protein
VTYFNIRVCYLSSDRGGRGRKDRRICDSGRRSRGKGKGRNAMGTSVMYMLFRRVAEISGEQYQKKDGFRSCVIILSTHRSRFGLWYWGMNVLKATQRSFLQLDSVALPTLFFPKRASTALPPVHSHSFDFTSGSPDERHRGPSCRLCGCFGHWRLGMTLGIQSTGGFALHRR